MAKKLPLSDKGKGLLTSNPRVPEQTALPNFEKFLNSKHGLVGLEPVLELVKTLLWTGQVAGERPASAIICAPIGSGKTSVLEKIECETARFLSDFTTLHGKDVIRDEKLTHIMIGDLLSVLNHKSGTVKNSINLLSKMTGDRVMTDPWTGDKITPRRLGVITAIPPEELYSKRLKSVLWGGGFASRFIIVKYNYTKATIKRIHDFIKSDAYTKMEPIHLDVERAQIQVKIPELLSEKIRILSQSIKNDEIGARAHHHLRALVKARARMRQTIIADDSDFDAIERIADFFTLDGRTI